MPFVIRGISEIRGNSVFVCIRNGWNGLPARLWRQPAAESRAKSVAHRAIPGLCSPQKDRGSETQMSQPARSEPNMTTDYTDEARTSSSLSVLIREIRGNSVFVCFRNGWNGLPARLWRQPAAKSRAKSVAHRAIPGLCSSPKDRGSETQMSHLARSEPNLTTDYSDSTDKTRASPSVSMKSVKSVVITFNPIFRLALPSASMVFELLRRLFLSRFAHES